jgi:hypothetical protein
MWAFSGLVHGADALPPAKVTRIMRQMRSGPIQLRALAEELERAKKRSVKDARSIWSMIRRLNSMNRIAAAKQVNDSRVRHFSRATDLSNAFQNVRWFRRRELRKYSPGGDDIFVPIFAG